jgi:murein DD-endopeptidase MepM/ murein hydrolase activator NlpD
VKYLRVTFLLIAVVAVTFSVNLSAEELFHIVGKGETIYSISRFYRVSPEELMKTNGITDPSKLQVGKRIVIPTVITTAAIANPQSLTDYRVAKGDTLFSISRNYDISLKTLQEINKFSSDHVIKAGDIIKVPAKNEPVKTVQNAPEKAIDASIRWPVNPKEISYMTGQLGVIVQGEQLEPVKSLTQGKVISAGPWRKFGKVAIVEVSGGYLYMYGGCESLSVKVGDKIGPGTELGKLGINSGSEKPQLFFMVFKSNTPIDPAKAPRAGGNVKT